MVEYANVPGSKTVATTTTYNNQPVTITVIPEDEIKEARIIMCAQPYLSPEKMVKTFDKQPMVFTNCSFFSTSSGISIWNLISDSVIYSQDSTAHKWGIGVLKNDNTHPLVLGDYGEGTDKWKDYSTVYPLLILNNERQDVTSFSDIDYMAQRMAVGMFQTVDTKKNYYFFVLVEGKGCKLSTLQTIVEQNIKTDNQYLAWVCNLDGGGSAYEWYNGHRLSEGKEGSWLRPVDSCLGIWLKDDLTGSGTENPDPEESEDPDDSGSNNPESNIPITKKFYRVVCGTFSSSENAKNMRTMIQALGQGVVDYTKAFISYDNQYYRVQIGAFSNSDGAQKVVDELESLGYDSYIRYM